MFHPQVAELVGLVHAVPDTPVVLDHLGGWLGIGPYADRRDEVRALADSSRFSISAAASAMTVPGG